MSDGGIAWADATLVAGLVAVDPAGLGGVALKGLAGPVRDRWLALLRELLPAGAPLRRLPLGIGDGRLLGGLDLAATLRAGRPVAERGLLVEADGGVVVLAMAERVAEATVARLTAVLDAGELCLERDGLAERHPARLGIVALDEGMAADERASAALLDRLAFQLDLGSIHHRDATEAAVDAEAVEAARVLLPAVRLADGMVEAVSAAAAVLGIGSLRAPLLALKVARTAAALAGRDLVAEEDVTLAARLVLAPRATTLPAVEEDTAEEEPPPAPEPQPDAASPPEGGEQGDGERPLEDRVVEAVTAALPADLLARLRVGEAGRGQARPPGRAGATTQSLRRGRPAGVRKGEPRGGARLNVVETLRAAAPWQPLRRREAGIAVTEDGERARILVRREDFRVGRFKQRTQTTTVFVVDASGSSALHRLAEAKGAVELLLADCYVRRDRVALLAFRGKGAELLLPPTRSLARAKRSLRGLPGGGGTPLAAGIDAAVALADAIRRRGETPVVIFMTDGRANIARDGGPGRARAEEEALAASRLVRAAGLATLLLDTSPRAQPLARDLATAMGALYLPLPHADARAVSAAAKAVAR